MADGAPQSADEVAAQVVDFVMDLRKDRVAEILRSFNLPRTGTREQLRERLIKGLVDEKIELDKLIGHLDAFEQWGKQHVFLYRVPANVADVWSDLQRAQVTLQSGGVLGLLGRALPLALPAELTLSSIRIDDGGELVVIAVQRRFTMERRRDLDPAPAGGSRIVLRAYEQRLRRILVTLRLTPTARTAALHISQLGQGDDYSLVQDEFFALVGGWLASPTFAPVDARPAIKLLHERERSGQPERETRSYALGYRTSGGRDVAATSHTRLTGVFGEAALDTALDGIRKTGTGRTGTFYWLPDPGNNGNPLTDEVGTVIIGDEGRINFPTPNEEAVIRYVLARVRDLSR